MAGLPIKPIDPGAIGSIARHFLYRDKPIDVTVVGTFHCAGCGRPHIVEIASSAGKPEGVVGVLSLALMDILDTYHIVADEEHTSWRHAE